MTSKFGEIKITEIEPRLQPLKQTNFDKKISSAFSNDGNRFNQPERLATFDSIHDFKTFGTNPVDTIEYQRKSGNVYNINKCFFNFNRIMCRGKGAISVENSFLSKPKGSQSGQGAYDNKPYPITSIANVEDYFCLLNLYNRASGDDLRIIGGIPKPPTTQGTVAVNFKAITQFIVERGWCDIVGSKAYINTITDVSPAFRKYYIQNKGNNNVEGITGITGSVSYRAIISQETSNDPAGSLGETILTTAFGDSNVLIESPSQSRTYVSEKVDSFFEPTLSGITDFSQNPLNFNTTLTLVDKSTVPLETISVVIPYAKSGFANPNERTIINKDINKEFPSIIKNNAIAVDSLNGRDDATHSEAIAFYANPDVDNFSKAESQKKIARHFTRKRLGDVLQASLCRLINSRYTDDSKRIKFNSLSSLGEKVIPKTAIFIGEDRMIIAYCLINKIPCIYDNKNYTILYMPKKTEGDMYSAFATMPATVTPVISGGDSNPNTVTDTILKQSGGEVTTRDMYKEIYGQTMRDEPYYFFKYLLIYAASQKETKLQSRLEDINKNIINGTYNDNVFNFDSSNNLIMYFVSPALTYEAVSKPLPREPIVAPEPRYVKPISHIGPEISDETPIIVAQQIVDKIVDSSNGTSEYTFINVFSTNTYKDPTNSQILLSVTRKQTVEGDRTIYYKDMSNVTKTFQVNISHLNTYFLANVNQNRPENYAIEPDEYTYSGGGVNAQYNEPGLNVSPTNLNSKEMQIADTGLYNKNVETLQNYFSILNKYEVYSIIDETNDAYFYDINDSGIRVAYDCFFYIFFNNLVNDFEKEADKVSYELLVYYLFKKQYRFIFNI